MNNEITTTKHIIDGVTYTVTASPSENTTETLHRKIEKLLLRDMHHESEYINKTEQDN
ncbi:MAG: transposon-encoded TnpW family protein [Oscillospiraceae bacterium]|jgi:hypothetical protein|nr:transposon-encoded TnpW family protein [Oscillospiraceae bacterium]